MFFSAGRSPKKSRHRLGASGKSTFSPGISFLVFSLFFSIIITPHLAFASYSQIAEFLCEEGIKDLNKGDCPQAKDEFNRALIAEPGYPPAIYYLELISEMSSKGQVTRGGKSPVPVYSSSVRLNRKTVMENSLDQAKTRETLGKDEGLSADQIFIPEL